MMAKKDDDRREKGLVELGINGLLRMMLQDSKMAFGGSFPVLGQKIWIRRVCSRRPGTERESKSRMSNSTSGN